jgi:hypothetical protein
MELVLNPVREGNGARTGLILRVIRGDDEVFENQRDFIIRVRQNGFLEPHNSLEWVYTEIIPGITSWRVWGKEPVIFGRGTSVKKRPKS